MFYENRKYFFGWLVAEIKAEKKLSLKRGNDFAVRLNGTISLLLCVAESSASTRLQRRVHSSTVLTVIHKAATSRRSRNTTTSAITYSHHDRSNAADRRWLPPNFSTCPIQYAARSRGGIGCERKIPEALLIFLAYDPSLSIFCMMPCSCFAVKVCTSSVSAKPWYSALLALYGWSPNTGKFIMGTP